MFYGAWDACVIVSGNLVSVWRDLRFPRALVWDHFDAVLPA